MDAAQLQSILEVVLTGRERSPNLDRAVDGVLEKLGPFTGKDVTRFLQVFDAEMLHRNIPADLKKSNFHRVVAADVLPIIEELQRQDVEWEAFRRDLLGVFNYADSTKMTRRAFEAWVELDKKHGSVLETLTDFEAKFRQLSVREQTLLEPEKVVLFLRSVPYADRVELGKLMESGETETGLEEDWSRIRSICLRYEKRRTWLGSKGLGNATPTSSLKAGTGIEASMEKPQPSDVDDLVKQFMEWKISSMSKAQHQPQVQRTLPIRDFRCLWCDSLEHRRSECVDHQEAMQKNLIFYKDRLIHSSVTRQPLKTNFGRGGMKKLLEEEELRHAQAIFHSTSAAIRLYELPKQDPTIQTVLVEDDCQRTGWSDPTFPTNYDVMVEEKRRREEVLDRERALKRADFRSPSEKQNLDMQKAEPTLLQISKKSSPTFRMRTELEQEVDAFSFIENYVLKQHVSVPLGDLLAVSKKEVQDDLLEKVRRKRIPVDTTMTAKEAGWKEGSTQVLKHEDNIPRSHFTRNHWARATTETKVRLGGLSEAVMALIDSGSEINLMSLEVYKQGGWPMTSDHHWRIRAATQSSEELSGACPDVEVSIGGVTVLQHFFIQDSATYPVILGQPFMVAVRMETKVLDDGSAYARIKDMDGGRTIQFQTVRPNHERNKDSLHVSSDRDF